MAIQQTKKGSRKRSRNTAEEDKQSYYERLLYQCRKDINKEAKRVKQFETQKLIRNHKKQQPPSKAGDSKLDELKAYDSLEPVIQECFRRLGILALNPDDSSSPPPTSLPSCWITDRILQHKRTRDVIDKWHDEVTSYRRWCLQQQEREERKQQGIKKPAAVTKPSKSSRPSGITTNDTPEDMQQASVFLQLGNDDAETNGEDAEDGKKKNRKGQRARRAKAMALEARRQGRALTREQSLNWRPKKKRDEVVEEPAAAVVEEAKAEEPLHPSWQARKEQKQTIVAFEGKKITF